ncbi:MAG TPA: hypothetical protein VLX85_12245 [Stellaceae bacterium]|nr:hypothetical protein [Stellaceae bacterium]
MDFSIYAQPRKFALPRLNKTAQVGGDAALKALVSGPIFFWRKGALTAGVIAGMATLPFWLINSDGYLLDAIGALVWLGTGVLAPQILAASYRRRGWVDVTDRRRPLDLNEDRENGDEPHPSGLSPEEQVGLILPPRRGRRLLDLEDDGENDDAAPATQREPQDRKGLVLPPHAGRRLLDLEDDIEPLDEPSVSRPAPENHHGLILPPRRGRLLDLEESDLD